MALAINIEDLLNKQKIESNRIEFKKGRNPASIILVESVQVKACTVFLFNCLLSPMRSFDSFNLFVLTTPFLRASVVHIGCDYFVYLIM